MTRKKPRKVSPNVGAKPKTESIRMYSVGRRGEIVRFAFSEDLVMELKKMHDAVFGALYLTSFDRFKPKRDPMAGSRLVFTRFMDWSLPVIHLRIEPPTYDPKGRKLFRAQKGRQYYVNVPARAIGVVENLKPLDVGFLFDSSIPKVLGGGMVLTFPDAALTYTGVKRRRAPKSFAEEPLAETFA